MTGVAFHLRRCQGGELDWYQYQPRCFASQSQNSHVVSPANLANDFNVFLNKLQPIVAEVEDWYSPLDIPLTNPHIATRISHRMQVQLSEVEQAPTASNEMSATAQEPWPALNSHG
jgi:hypothetical protein